MSIALCIPAYNASWCLPKLLKSALDQEFPFNEILVYNDASNDDTTLIAEEFGAIVVEGKVNVGCSSGKNKLAEISKSDWLHFHDADDDLLPNFTSVCQKWINMDLSPDIVLMHFHYIDKQSGHLLGKPEYDSNEILKDTIKFTITNKIVNFALIKKESFLRIGGFDTDPEVLYNEDRAFYTRASINGLTFAYENELTCINYFYGKGMSSSNKAKVSKAQYAVLNKVYKSVGEKYNVELSEQFLNNATYAATANDWGTMIKSIRFAKNIYPQQVPVGSVFFQKIYRLNSYFAFFLRELIIRFFTSKRRK